MNDSMPKRSHILLLSAGAFFLLFSNGRFSFSLAAWLYPLCLLRVSRDPSSGVPG
ncbi:MAG: hypothetical protein QM733_24840 [Ilumatobacteraceae bacterium]